MKKKKEKPKKVDGLGPEDIKKIEKALRKVWSWSHARKLVIKRCTDAEGFGKCEKCKKRCPKVAVDHTVPIGTFNGGYIERMFVPSSQMRGLCSKCHKVKTKSDIANIKAKRLADQDFY